MSEPEWLEGSVAGRINAWRKVGEKFPRVTYEGNAQKLIITAMLKQKGPVGW